MEFEKKDTEVLSVTLPSQMDVTVITVNWDRAGRTGNGFYHLLLFEIWI